MNRCAFVFNISMIFFPWKEKQKQKKQIAFCAFSLLCLLFVNVSFATDVDGDGLAVENDNTDLIDIFTSHITIPTERQAIIDADLEGTFSGDAEVGTQVRVFESGDSICTTDVSGNGISVGTSSAVTIDGTDIISSASVAQFFYDTGTDSDSTAWRSNEDNSWHEGTDFPAKTIIVVLADSFRILNATTRSSWKTFSESGITSVFALNGKVYVGKSTGLKIYDFANDDFTTVLTTVSTPAIINNAVTSLDGKTVGGKDYIVAGTSGGISVYNETDDTVISKTTTAVIDAGVDTDDKVRFALSATSFVSDDTVDTLLTDWDVTDISTGTNFSSGTGQATGGDLIGHSSGATYVESLRTDIEEGLIYKETFDSLSGVANNAYANGTVTEATITTGITSTDSALDFNGTTSTVETDITSNDDFQNGFTISAWIKPNGVGETAGRIIDKSDASPPTDGFAVYTGGSNIQMRINAFKIHKFFFYPLAFKHLPKRITF